MITTMTSMIMTMLNRIFGLAAGALIKEMGESKNYVFEISVGRSINRQGR